MSKILHLCLASCYNDEDTYQDNLLPKYHVKIGFEVSLICSNIVWNRIDRCEERCDKEIYYNEYGVKVIRIPMKKELMSIKFKRFVGLYDAIDGESPDIIFLHGIGYLDNTKIVKYCKVHPNVELYADNHADFSNSATNWISKNILHKVIWRYYAHKLVPYTKMFYGVLPARVDFLIDIYKLPPDKCKLLVMGADDDMVKKADNYSTCREIRKKYGIDEDDFLVITGGVINKWKYQTILLMEAVQNISPEKHVKLIVFGTIVPEIENKFKALSDGKIVQYIGWLHANETYKYFATADLVVFPGRHSVFWEQVTGQGIPMLVKDWPGTHHVDLGGNVLFLKNDSSDEIQNYIEFLLENPEFYQKMKNIAQKRGMKAFSYKEIAKRSILI